MSRSSADSCGSTVLHWWCLNDCYQLDKTQREILVNVSWFFSNELTDLVILELLSFTTLPMHATTQRMLMRSIVNTEMVTTDNGSYIPTQYPNFVEVFSKDHGERFLQPRPIRHLIDLETNYKLPYGQIYNLFKFVLKTLKVYIEMNLVNSFIQQLSFFTTVWILFAKRTDIGLQLYWDDGAFNHGLVKDRYSFSLMSKLLHWVHVAHNITTLDLWNDYCLIQIKEGKML